MTSTISWLDASADDQRHVNEIVRMFSQRETQDAMGGRRIVVALSDALFPGTSVLHQRARYLLFVPWLCHRAINSKDPVRRLDSLERQLITAFQTDTEVPAEDRLVGLIGRTAGAEVKQLPSIAYWTALDAWGILEWSGSIKNTLDRMAALPGMRRSDGSDELAERATRVWHPGVGPGKVPKEFPDSSIEGGFRLTPAEAQWLRERWLDRAGGSMLAHLVTAGDRLTSSLPWEQPACWSSTPENTAILEHAKWFSTAIAGAQYLYSLQVAEHYVDRGFNRVDVDLDWYRQVIADWQEEVNDAAAAIAQWDPAAFWAEISACGVAIDPLTRQFFSVWFDVLRTGGGSIADDPGLRDLVRTREIRLKSRAQSRLVNDALLASWGGGAAGRTEYRWTSVRQLVNDVLDGLAADDVGT